MTSRLSVVVVVVVVLSLLWSPSPGYAFDRSGEGALGASVGGLAYLGDDDSREDAQPRFGVGGFAEYSPSESWAVRFESGVGWVGYPEGKHPNSENISSPEPVKVVSPTTITLIRRLNPASDDNFYIGAGLGIYYWVFKISGREQVDPVTFEKIGSGNIGSFDPGVNALLGYEYSLGPSVSLIGEAHGHYVFSANEDDRPDKTDPAYDDFPVFNGNDIFVQGRFGVKIYFDLIRFEEPEEDF